MTWYWLIYFYVSIINIPAERPSDWFYTQRAFPYDSIPQAFYHQALNEIIRHPTRFTRSAPQSWKFEGPTNIGGRITDVEAVGTTPGTIYVGAASGGIFKSVNGGNSWVSIFDQNPLLSIGDMALNPANPNHLLVGTGEANGGGGSMSYEGNGVFKTLDGGVSWTPLGLEFSGSIPKILFHPKNQEVVYVAAMGRMFGKNNQRGIYKSTNGGSNWEQVLFHSDSVGAIDLIMDTRHPDTLYAALWERSRKPSGIDYGGPACGVYRSFDGGKVWVKLSQGLPTGSNLGRIGLALAPSSPNIVFAYYMDESGDFLGIYKSVNAGDQWSKTNARIDVATFGWWFGKIYVAPDNPQIVYALGLSGYKSLDGGNQFNAMTENFSEDVHVDQHALYIDPVNPSQLLLGNDGGLYSSSNYGDNWKKINNLPITQFYTCHIDYSQPERLYGGTQDNSSIRTLTGGPDQWQIIWSGDGFVCLVDPQNSQNVYTESQYGVFVRSTDGGQSFNYALSGIDGADRKNWNTPVVFHPGNSSTLFLGTHRLYRSTDKAVNWSPISPALTLETNSRTYGTITCISVSPVDPQIIYCGTDMGQVWVTLNGGGNWVPVHTGLPQRWITSVTADPLIKNRVYVTLSGYRYNESMPHVFVSENNGSNWSDISKGLPPIPCNKLVVDPAFSGHIIVATDGGIWRSYNNGKNWEILGNELPLMVMTSLDFHPPTRKLIAASYGRGLFSYALELPVNQENQDKSSISFEVGPNPFQNTLRIIISSELAQSFELSIHTVSGKSVWQKSIRSQSSPTTIEYSDNNLTPGIYLLTGKSQNGATLTKKLIRW